MHEGTPGSGAGSNTFHLLGLLGSQGAHALQTGPQMTASLRSAGGTLAIADGTDEFQFHPSQVGYDRASTNTLAEVPGAGNGTPEATPSQLQGALAPGGAIARQQGGVAKAGPPSSGQRPVPVPGPLNSNRMVDEEGRELGVEVHVPDWIKRAPSLNPPSSWDHYLYTAPHVVVGQLIHDGLNYLETTVPTLLARAGGALQGTIGVSQAALAGALISAPEPTMLTKILGGAMLIWLAHDNMHTGAKTIVSGKPEETSTTQTLAKVGEVVGIPGSAANSLARSLDFALNVGSFFLRPKVSAPGTTSPGTTSTKTPDGLKGVGDPRFATTVETAAAEGVGVATKAVSPVPLGFRRVYRAVSEAEYQDALQSGEFRPGPPGSYDYGKFFADTLESAQAHGNGLFTDGKFRLLEADIPENAPSMYRHPNMDQRGPATYLDFDDLKGVVPRPLQ